MTGYLFFTEKYTYTYAGEKALALISKAAKFMFEWTKRLMRPCNHCLSTHSFYHKIPTCKLDSDYGWE